jgi:uncharacterized damage-inducible protein DinB
MAKRSPPIPLAMGAKRATAAFAAFVTLALSVYVFMAYDKAGNHVDGKVKVYMETVELRMRDYLNSMPTGGLSKKYTLKNDADETIEVTAEDVLIHVFEEEVHHRGELIALLWQMGVEPPPMGWKDL